MLGSKRLFLSVLFLVLIPFFAYAQQTPETRIISGVSGTVSHGDVVFMWMGQSTDRPILGYYYTLGNAEPVFTDATQVTFFDLFDGIYSFSISAIDIDGVIDPTPAFENFQVSRNVQLEVEFNGQSNFANYLQSGRILQGMSLNQHDDDWYKFDVSNVGAITVSLKRVGGTGLATAKIYQKIASDANKIAEFHIDQQNAQRQIMTIGVAEGSYFIQIQPGIVDFDFTGYTLAVSPNKLGDGVAWDVENNDTFADASPLKFPANQQLTLIGSQNSIGDLDWFTLQILRRQKLKVIFERLGASSQTMTYLYRSPVGNEVSRQVGLLEATTLNGHFAQLETYVAPGNYLFKIDNGTFQEAINYVVLLQLEEIGVGMITEFEPNNISPLLNPNSADRISLGKTLVGSSWNGNEDIDWFQISIPNLDRLDQSILHISFERSLGIGSTRLEVFSHSGIKVGELKISAQNDQSGQLSVPVNNRTLILRLTPTHESAMADYRLRPTLIKSARHLAEKALVLDEKLIVEVKLSQSVSAATFDLIGDFTSPSADFRTKNIPLIATESSGNDTALTGSYQMLLGDDATSVTVMVKLTDSDNRILNINLPNQIEIDTTVPEIKLLEHNGRGVLIAGDQLEVVLHGDVEDVEASVEIIDAETGFKAVKIPMKRIDNNWQAIYQVKPSDTIKNGIVVARLTDDAGNTATVQTQRQVNLIGKSPKIISADHDADLPLGLGQTLTVTMVATTNGTATFSINDPISMTGDGQGVYVGRYIVQEGDQLKDAKISIGFVDQSGQRVDIEVSKSLTIDGNLPESVRVLEAVDVPDDQGFRIYLKWEPSVDPTLSHYNVYLSDRPIREVGKPILGNLKTTSTVLSVPLNNVPFYIAITATDSVGNVSRISAESVVNRVKTIDNLPPNPVVLVSAIDTPDDAGKSVTVSWTHPSFDSDFHKYRIYASELSPTNSSAVLELQSEIFNVALTSVDVSTVIDNKDQFFLVTAIDKSGNESAIVEDAISAATHSTANVILDSDGLLRFQTAPIGLIHYNSPSFRWSSFRSETKYRYQLDQHSPRIINATKLLLRDLAPGSHQLRVETLDGKQSVIRRFSVSDSLLSENEPNNNSDQANNLPLNWEIRADAADIDFYQIQVEHKGVLDIYLGRNISPLTITVYRGQQPIAVGQVQPNKLSPISIGVLPESYLVVVENDSQAVSLYSLSTQFTISEVWETEPNDQVASPMPIDTVIRGSQTRQGDRDLHRLQLNQAGLLVVNVTSEDENPNMELILKDETGVVGRSKESVMTAEVKSGTYFLEITPESEYRLIATLVERANFWIDDGTKNPPRNLLRSGDSLVVDISWHGETSFSLDGVTSEVALKNPASIKIPNNLDISDVSIGVTLVNSRQNAIHFELSPPLEIHTTTPNSIQNLVAFDTPDDAGGNVTLSWARPGDLANLAGYKIYLFDEGPEEDPSASRLESEVNDPLITQISISTDVDDIDLFFAVIAVDLYGNESKITDSSTDGPVRSTNNKMPPNIISARHNATKTLVNGDILNVELTGDRSKTASFSITGVVENIKLFDDGKHDDKEANDGHYAGSYQVKPKDLAINTLVEVTLNDGKGNHATQAVAPTISVDAIPPRIKELAHDAKTPLKAGDTLSISLLAESNIIVKFEIVDKDRIVIDTNRFSLVQNIQLEDNQKPDGDKAFTMPMIDFRSSLVIQEGDDLTDGHVRATVQKLTGKAIILMSTTALTVDTISPDKVADLTAVDRPSDQGYVVRLSWQANQNSDFDHYRIYLSNTPISPYSLESIKFLTTKTESEMVKVEQNNADIYLAVTAVDVAGNIQQDLSMVTTQAIDNIPPVPVQIVLATDSPNDFGGQVTLALRSPNFEPDFAGYRVYVSGDKIAATQGLRPILTIPDRNLVNIDVPSPSDKQPYFYAITAIDTSANESQLNTGSVTLAIQSANNIGREIENPVQIVSGPIGTVRRKAVTFHLFSMAESPIVFSLNNQPLRSARLNQLTFHNLKVGSHTFSAKLTNDSRTTVRNFTIVPTFTVEIEPNNSPFTATPLTSNGIMLGSTNAELDIDWFQVTLNRETSSQLDLHFDRSQGIGRTNITVLSSDLQVLSEIAADPSTRQRIQISLGIGFGTDDLLIKVQASGENPAATYNLSIAKIRRLPVSILEIEPNDTLEVTQSIDLGNQVFEIVGRADRPQDIDYFELNVPLQKLLTINFQSTPKATVQILSEKEQIGQLDSKNKNWETMLTTGRYKLRVANANGTYRIAIKPKEVLLDKWELEPNGDIRFATLIKSNTVVNGSLSLTDRDWFKLVTNERGILSVALSGESIQEAKLTLHSVVGGTIKPKILSATNTTTFSIDAFPGTYYLKIEANASFSKYQLTPVLVTKVSHNAVDRILGTNETLTVQFDWIPDQQANLRIVKAEQVIDIRPMTHQGNGHYVSQLKMTDNLAVVKGSLIVDLAISNHPDLINSFLIEDSIHIDTLPPKIERISHKSVRPNGTVLPVGLDQNLIIRMVGEARSMARFRIEADNFSVIGEMFDDGKHDDQKIDDGIYSGFYTVSPGDNVSRGKLIGLLKDSADNTSQLVSNMPVVLDTDPPEIQSIAYTVKRPQQGFITTTTLLAGDILTITLTGTPNCKATFHLDDMAKDLSLFDDGTHSDLTPNDGIYTNFYVVRKENQTKSVAVITQLTDLAGNENEQILSETLNIDTDPPEIKSIRHSAGSIALVQGDKLIVYMEGEPGGTAIFDIGSLKTDLPLFDDGSGEDSEPNDGTYTGLYQIVAGDSVHNAMISARLIDQNGNSQMIRAGSRLTIDAVPPDPIRNIKVTDQPDDQGNVLIITWDLLDQTDDFARYQIYRETAPIRSTFSLIPIPINLLSANRIEAKVNVPRNNFNYYVAVTVVDLAGNESLTEERQSIFGPVQATDDLPPPSVTDVTASDKPSDNGKTLVVHWAPVLVEDFARVDIYVESNQIKKTNDLKPVLSITDPNVIEAELTIELDNTNYFVAVIAADENQNNSTIGTGSIAGPVQTKDEIPPLPVVGVSAIDTLSDNGKSLTVSWTLLEEVDVYQVYLSLTPIGTKDIRGLKPVIVKDDKEREKQIDTPADGIDLFVAVTAADVAGNRSELDEASVAGPVQSVSNLIVPNIPTTITAGFDPKTQIAVPANEVGSRTTVIDIVLPTDADIISQIEEANYFLEQAHIDDTTDIALQNTTRQFILNGEKGSSFQITMSYDGREVPQDVESKLRIFSLNPYGRIILWELVSGSQFIDFENKTITASTNRLSVFRIARLQLPNNLNNVVVHPNPFRPNITESKEITFEKLTENSIIDIFTLNGELVKSDIEGRSGYAIWDGRNDGGSEVVSGLYVYLIRSDIDKAVGKILIIR